MKTRTCLSNLEGKKRKVIQNAHGPCYQELPMEALKAHIHIRTTILAPPGFNLCLSLFLIFFHKFMCVCIIIIYLYFIVFDNIF